MSNTPRTDAARQDEHDPYMSVASECAKLELELNAAQHRIKRLQAIINRAWIEFFEHPDRKASKPMHRILEEGVLREGFRKESQ